MNDYYNHKIKVFPDGTEQHFVYQNSIKIGSEKIPHVGGTSSKKSQLDHQKRARAEVFDLCRSNTFDLFITLTFNPQLVDSFNYKECCDHIKSFTRILRSLHCDYILVPEKHNSGRWHFHGVVRGSLVLTPAINPVSLRVIDGVYNIPVFSFGFTTASYIKFPDRVSTYLAKYLTKDMCLPKHSKRYWCSQGLSRPREVVEEVDIRKLAYLALEADYSKSIDSDFGKVFFYEIKK